jgi:hypothetical protein
MLAQVYSTPLPKVNAAICLIESVTERTVMPQK